MLKEGKSYCLQTTNLFFVLRKTRVIVKQLLKDVRKELVFSPMSVYLQSHDFLLTSLLLWASQPQFYYESFF